MGTLQSSHYMEKTGWHFLSALLESESSKFLSVFVDALFSTLFDWVQTINGLQGILVYCKHYQFWIFGYPDWQSHP